MRAQTKLLAALCFASFASSVSLRAVDPMLPEIAHDLSVTLRQAALLASAYAFPYALMQLVFGPAGDAVGRSRLIRLSVAMVTAGAAICAVTPSFALALIARMLAGAFAGGIVPVCLALIGDRTSIEERQPALSRVMVATVVGQMSGAAGSGVLTAALGWRAMFALTTVICALAWLSTLLFLDGRSDRRSRLTFGTVITGYRLVFANPASLLIFIMVAGEGLFLFGVFPFVAPMLVTHGPTGPLQAGITLAAFAFGGVGYGLAVRFLVARFAPRGMLRLGATIAGLAYMATAAAFLPWPAVALLFLIGGFGFYMLHNTLQTLATELAPTARGATFALFSSMLFLGQGIGPIAAGAVVHGAGFGPVFLAAGALLILTVLAASHRLPQ